MPKAKKLASGSWRCQVVDHYEVVDGKRKEIAHHVWQCSHLNATKATVPQSLLDVLGGEA